MDCVSALTRLPVVCQLNNILTLKFEWKGRQARLLGWISRRFKYGFEYLLYLIFFPGLFVFVLGFLKLRSDNDRTK